MRVVGVSHRFAVLCLRSTLVLANLFIAVEFADLGRAQDSNTPPVSSGPVPESAASQSLPAIVVPAPPETKTQRAKQQEQQR